ncbi:MAG: ABC transporter ATP-binding protein [Candidatus Omnitrophota bacterium]
MVSLLEVSHLSKTFYPTPTFSQIIRKGLRKYPLEVLKDAHLTLREGDLYCLMGPNGAGKTTLLKILCGLILPENGLFRLFGETLSFEHPRLRGLFGLVTGEERSFYWRLTGRQNLEFFAAFYSLPRKELKKQIEEFSSLLHLEGHLDKYFFTYSTGMKQQLGLCRGLLGDPKVLLLDEPTRSLDPVAAQEWRCFLREVLLEKKKKTVLYTTHQPEEAATFSSRIGILHRGRIVVEGDLATLKKNAMLEEKATLFDVFLNVMKGNSHVP